MIPLIFDRCLGAIETMTPLTVPDGYVCRAENIELNEQAVCLPRVGMTATASSADPLNSIFYNHADDDLWSFGGSGTALTTPAYQNGSSVTLPDTPAGQFVSCVAYNGKTFMGYLNNENRLHCWDGTSIRRVGIGLVAAATVANTGAGAYAAVLRYYKVQMAILSGSTVIASSELSASVSFTPSGAGTAARITKPTTIDSATHWRVWASSDGTTYYNLSSYTAVGTTTIDDTSSPTAYLLLSEVAPEAGLFVPPPAALYLATNGERIFMCGGNETATTGETTMTPRRVWFTRPLGATDEGDDEAITQTSGSRYYLDIDNEDGSIITGIVSTLDGSVYVSTATSLWKLSDTGTTDAPVRADRVVAISGAWCHQAMTTVDAGDASMIYFMAPDGPYRYSPATGVQWLGADWATPSDSTVGLPGANYGAVGYEPVTRRIFWADYRDDRPATARVLNPRLLRNIDGVMRGGWSKDVYGMGINSRIRCFTQDDSALIFGGATNASAALLMERDPSVSTDNAGTVYTTTIQSRDVMVGDGTRNFKVDDPFLWKNRLQSLTLTFSRNFGGTYDQVSETITGSAPTGDQGYGHRVKVEGLELADAYLFSFSITATTPTINQYDRQRDGLWRILVPVTLMEMG